MQIWARIACLDDKAPTGDAVGTAVGTGQPLEETPPVVAAEFRLPPNVSVVVDNPFHEAQYLRYGSEGSVECQHLDVRPCRTKEVRASEKPQRVFLPDSLVQRGIRFVLDGAAVAMCGITVIA